jgi:hypothetical protein
MRQVQGTEMEVSVGAWAVLGTEITVALFIEY